MRKFTASMSFDLSSDTTPEARQLLIAELVGRRWKDRLKKRRMPLNTLFIQKGIDDDKNTSDLHDMCAEDLRNASRAVAKMGKPIGVLRAFIQVSGGGTYGLAAEGVFDSADDT
jgi:hypothetical protein